MARNTWPRPPWMRSCHDVHCPSGSIRDSCCREHGAVIVLTFPSGAEGSAVEVRFDLTDRDGALAAPPQAVTWTFASHRDNDAQPRDRVVDRAVAELQAALAREQALDLNRRGKFDEARRLLEALCELLLKRAGDDSELQTIARNLATDQETLAACMSPASTKAMHFRSYSVQHMRQPDGKAKRK
jgi:hypothetical protein